MNLRKKIIGGIAIAAVVAGAVSAVVAPVVLASHSHKNNVNNHNTNGVSNLVNTAFDNEDHATILSEDGVTVAEQQSQYTFNVLPSSSSTTGSNTSLNLDVNNPNNVSISYAWYVNATPGGSSLSNSMNLGQNTQNLEIPDSFLSQPKTWYFIPVYYVNGQANQLPTITVVVQNPNITPTMITANAQNSNITPTISISKSQSSSVPNAVYANQKIQILLNNPGVYAKSGYNFELQSNVGGSWYTVNTVSAANQIYFNAPGSQQYVQLRVVIYSISNLSTPALTTNAITVDVLPLGSVAISAPGSTVSSNDTIYLTSNTQTIQFASQLSTTWITNPAYQWETKNIDNLWIPIAGANQSTWSVTGNQIPNQANPYMQTYRLVVSSKTNPDNYLVSNSIFVKTPNLQVGQVSISFNNTPLTASNSTAYNGVDAIINTPFTLTASVTGSSFHGTGLAYQWQDTNSSGQWQNIQGATGPSFTYTPTTSNSDAEFRCKVGATYDWALGQNTSKIINISILSLAQERQIQMTKFKEWLSNPANQESLMTSFFTSKTGLQIIYNNLSDMTNNDQGWLNNPISFKEWLNNWKVAKAGTQANGMAYVQMQLTAAKSKISFMYTNPSNGNTENIYFNQGTLLTVYLPYSAADIQNLITATPSLTTNGSPELSVSFNENNLMFNQGTDPLPSNIQMPGYTITDNGKDLLPSLQTTYQYNNLNQSFPTLTSMFTVWNTNTPITITQSDSDIPYFSASVTKLLMNGTPVTTYNIASNSSSAYKISVNPMFSNGYVPKCTYQWYVNSTDSTTGGTAMAGATTNNIIVSANFKITKNITKYYYCVVTYENNGVPTKAISNIYTVNYSLGWTIA